LKILLVDADRTLADSINGELEHTLVIYAPDGEVGLKIALEKQFDLIVLNWALPEKDGLSVLKELREQKILSPILMLIAEDALKDVIMSLDSGANDCVSKPFEMHVLIARIKALIRRSTWDLCAEIRHEHIPHATASGLSTGSEEFYEYAAGRLHNDE